MNAYLQSVNAKITINIGHILVHCSMRQKPHGNHREKTIPRLVFFYGIPTRSFRLQLTSWLQKKASVHEITPAGMDALEKGDVCLSLRSFKLVLLQCVS